MTSEHEIHIKAIIHHEEKRILFLIPRDKQLDELVRQLPGCRWSQSLKGWHIGNNPQNLRLIFSTFKGIATIDKTGVFGPELLKLNTGGNKELTTKISSVELFVLSEMVSRKVDEFVLC